MPQNNLSPKLFKGGLVLIDPESSKIERVITLQFNPESLSRSFQVQSLDQGTGDKSQAMRIKGPAIESISLEAVIDATDGLEESDSETIQYGVLRELSALESLLNPNTDDLISNNELANSGTLEIIPMESLLSLFVWSENRVIPVRLTELSVTEEAFNNKLVPIRAKVGLSMRVLTVDDLGFDHKGGSLFMHYLKSKEVIGQKAVSTQLTALGIGNIP